MREKKTPWKKKKFELCLYSSLKINCLIFFWKESEVWQAAMSLVKSWKLRKLSEKSVREKSVKKSVGEKHVRLSPVDLIAISSSAQNLAPKQLKKYSWTADLEKLQFDS